MKNIGKKLCIGGLALLIAVSGCGCGLVQDIWRGIWERPHVWDPPNGSAEEEIYLEAANQFLAAIEAGDRDAVRDCFSVNAREACPEMEEQIDRLLELCSGPVALQNEDDLSLFGEYSSDHGKRTALAGTTLLYTCGDEYFWCYMGLTYQDDADADNVGITYANMETAAFACARRSDENYGEMPDFQAPGLRVLTEEQLERPVEGEIRVVRGDPILYTPAAVLDEAEAAAFLQQDASYTAFVERFGPPCGGWVYAYYELPPENGEPRYLCMSWDEGNDEIYSASVCDEVESLRLVWKQEENGTIK